MKDDNIGWDSFRQKTGGKRWFQELVDRVYDGKGIIEVDLNFLVWTAWMGNSVISWAFNLPSSNRVVCTLTEELRTNKGTTLMPTNR